MSNPGRRVHVIGSNGEANLYTIGAVASALGVCTETVRRAHAAGRLPPPTTRLQCMDGSQLRLYNAQYLALAPTLFTPKHRH